VPTERDRIVVVTRKTGLEELLERFVTREQARFYLEHSGVPFEPYEVEQRLHDEALTRIKAAFPGGVRSQFVERSFLPMFAFGERDLVVTLGPDGMVVNVAKYLRGEQPILAFNPDASTIDGILIAFRVGEAKEAIRTVLRGDYRVREVTMARATLGDSQSLLAFNDLFIGRKTHVSARYHLTHGRRSEDQSSSGIIVSTGAGSTGWLSSVLNGAAGVIEPFAGEQAVAPLRGASRFAWDAKKLRFSVREPFVSKASSARIVWGDVLVGEKLEVVSQMPQEGVIFSDGIETDYLSFDSSAVASISVADEKARLIAA
jgi:NAD kinase